MVAWKTYSGEQRGNQGCVGNVLFGHPASENMNLMSPCNTSDGWLKKKWKTIDGKRCLIKSGSNPFMQEPFNEVFGTRLHERLQANLHELTQNNSYVTYCLLLEGNVPCCVCDNIIDTHTELANTDRHFGNLGAIRNV